MVGVGNQPKEEEITKFYNNCIRNESIASAKSKKQARLLTFLPCINSRKYILLL
jgi:hypothetical protein